MEAFQTEFEFTLPIGYTDETGNLHRQGIMRLSTAADEVVPMKDPRVQQNPAYLAIILLSRVITKLGNLKLVTPKTIEDLFSGDFSYLQELYNRINPHGVNAVEASCPKCDHKFHIQVETAQGEV